MQVSLEVTTGLERRLKVGVPAVRIDSAVETRLQDAAKRVRIDGFRPGKVPMAEIRRRYGSAIRQEVLGDVMRQSFIEAVQQEKLNPAGNPRIEPVNMEPGRDLEFVAVFEVYPEVTVAGIDGFPVEKPVGDVTDADVEEMIRTLRQQRATPQEVARAAAKGDVVEADFTGTRNGVEFKGGSAQGARIVLGSGRMIPGFEEGLVGAKAGDERTLDLVFPADYGNEELKGQAATFKVSVKKVFEQVPPELDEAFFVAFGIKTSDPAKFRAEVRKNMERELRSALRNKVKAQVMEQLVAKVNVELPKALVTQEVQRLRQNMMQQFGGAQIDPSLLPDELFSEQARKSVALGLIVGAIVSKESIRVDGDRVRKQVEEIAESYETPKDVVNWYYGNPEQLRQIELAVLEEQVVERVIRDAVVTEKPVSYQEAVRPAQGR
ncbi:MAG: trigger factor [Pseudomonadota bacterium]